MNKIPTLFERDESRRYVTDVVTPGCEWVLRGEGVATRRYDGTCVRLDEDFNWWCRREVKEGKTAPDGFVPVENDTTTAKVVGWIPAETSDFWPLIAEATADRYVEHMVPGTYELIGPKINKNPEGRDAHQLILHGEFIIGDAPRDYEGLRDYLTHDFPFEGIVWWHEDGRKAKLKKRDFSAPPVGTQEKEN
jgi:hypothetical protein